MKIAYMILAHNTPNHLFRLIKALSSTNTTFFVHIDNKSNIDQYLPLKNYKNIILLDNRISVYWGDFSIVRAEINLLEAALDYGEKFDRFILMTGSDYPIQTREFIEDFFSKNDKIEFMNIVKMPHKTKPLSRLTEYNFIPCRMRINKKLRRAIIKLFSLFYKRNYKKILKDLIPYGGSQTWAITPSAAKYIVDFCYKNDEFLNFFKYTHAPDEAFFQTILANSSFKNNILRATTYSEWGEGMASPCDIDENIINKIINNPVFPSDGLYGGGQILFARKFTDNSKHLTDIIDKYLLKSSAKRNLM